MINDSCLIFNGFTRGAPKSRGVVLGASLKTANLAKQCRQAPSHLPGMLRSASFLRRLLAMKPVLEKAPHAFVQQGMKGAALGQLVGGRRHSDGVRWKIVWALRVGQSRRSYQCLRTSAKNGWPWSMLIMRPC